MLIAVPSWSPARTGSPGPRRARRGGQPTTSAIGGEFLSHHLPDDVEGRAPVDVFQQGFVDQGLVVAAAGMIYHPAKVVEDRVVQADRDLGFAGLGPDGWPTAGPREVGVSVSSSGPFQWEASGNGPPAAPWVPGRRR